MSASAADLAETGAALPSAAPADTGGTLADMSAYARPTAEGECELHLMVEGMYCGACIQTVEGALKPRAGVTHARVNYTTRRLVVRWRGAADAATDLARAVVAKGYKVVPYDPQALASSDQTEQRALLRALAVAGFGAGNVMLLSVSVWAGHFEGMSFATRSFFHWLSALIALPCIVIGLRPFAQSAFAALKARRTNMDVPVTIGVILASAASLWETLRGGPHVYFDSAVTLLFFLLIGRVLDRRARGRARETAERLLALAAQAVRVMLADGVSRHLPIADVKPGMTVLVAAGERIPVDGTVASGVSEIDTSLINGETLPRPARAGDALNAGMLNLAAPLTLTVTAVGEGTLLAEIVRLMEAAEQRRARYMSLADRLVRYYTPTVHGLALASFLGWTLFGGMAWQEALLIAVAVLIITCPCALALAVPAVQVIASGRLLRAGILLKSPTALERLAVVDTVVFDKTGTLTHGRLSLIPGQDLPTAAIARAAALAAASRHPLARAVAALAPEVPPADGVVEVIGEGLRWVGPEGESRLGHRAFALAVAAGETAAGADAEHEAPGPELWFVMPGAKPLRLRFADPPRADAAETVARLTAMGLDLRLLSGDRPAAVGAVAQAVGIAAAESGCTPARKTAALEAMAAEGRRVLMVGDGINDAPALAAAHVSLSPASGTDIAQATADAVFQGDRLAAVPELIDVARRADRLVRLNFALALGYNLVTIPLAMAGLVTPLIAAISMSSSSIIVIGNALRLTRGPKR